MTQRIVNPLEIIEIEEHHRDIVGIAMGIFDHLRQAIQGQETVWQICQGIVMRLVQDLLFLFFLLSNICFQRQVAGYSFIGIVHRRNISTFPKYIPAFGPVLKLTLPCLSMTEVSPELPVPILWRQPRFQ